MIEPLALIVGLEQTATHFTPSYRNAGTIDGPNTERHQLWKRASAVRRQFFLLTGRYWPQLLIRVSRPIMGRFIDFRLLITS